MQYNYGIVGVPGVVVSCVPDEQDMSTALQVSQASGKDYWETLRTVTFNRARKRWAQEGAEETRYFPMEEE